MGDEGAVKLSLGLLASFSVLAALITIFADKVSTIRWPDWDSTSTFNRVAGWAMSIWFGLGVSLGARLAFSMNLDQPGLIDVIASVLNLVGFVSATYFVLTPSQLKSFIVGTVPNIFGWAYVGFPFGMYVASQVCGAFNVPNATGVANVSMILIAVCVPIARLLERARKDLNIDSRMGLFASALVLTGSALQLGTSTFRFAS